MRRPISCPRPRFMVTAFAGAVCAKAAGDAELREATTTAANNGTPKYAPDPPSAGSAIMVNRPLSRQFLVDFNFHSGSIEPFVRF